VKVGRRGGTIAARRFRQGLSKRKEELEARYAQGDSEKKNRREKGKKKKKSTGCKSGIHRAKELKIKKEGAKNER